MQGRKSVILYIAGTIIYCRLFVRTKNRYMIHSGQYIYDEYKISRVCSSHFIELYSTSIVFVY